MTEIYYFSGTGNSLFTARKIAGKLKGKVISIASLNDRKTVQTNADVIGLVFPVYYSVNLGGVPLIVENFIRKLEFTGSYLFVVCTYGLMAMSAGRFLFSPLLNGLRKKVLESLNRFIGTTGLAIRELISMKTAMDAGYAQKCARLKILK